MAERMTRRSLLRVSGSIAAGVGLAGCLRLSQTGDGPGNGTGGNETTQTRSPDLTERDNVQPTKTEEPQPPETDDPTATPAEDTEPAGEVTVAGSPLLEALTVAVGEQAQREFPDLSVVSEASSVSEGFERFATGEAPVVTATRELTTQEREAVEPSFEPLQLRLGTDLIIYVVNNDNDWVDVMTPAELTDIWAAGTTSETWSEISTDWPDEPLDLFGPASSRELSQYVSATVGGDEQRIRGDIETAEDFSLLLQAVASNTFACSPLSYSDYMTNPETVKVLGVETDGRIVDPTLETAAEYPYTRPCYLYVNSSAYERQAAVREFVRAYASSATALPAEYGFVPIDDSVAAENRELL
jgi:phosphate transport system substrate-binding protein